MTLTPEQFRAAVEKIVGVPADRCQPFPVWTLHMDPFPAQLSYREDVKVLEIRWSQFVPRMLESWGANPYNGTWHLWFKDSNNDPEAVLRELTRRLAKVGYVTPAEVKPGLTAAERAAKRNYEFVTSEAYREGMSESYNRETVGHMARFIAEEYAADLPVSGCIRGLTEEERRHLTALMETAVEPQENRPPGMVGSIWQGQQDAWASILKKLKP